MRSRGKVKRLEPLSRIRRRLDRMWRERALREARGRCAFCGREKPLDVHHLLGRTGGLRWSLRNAMCLCKRCHKWGRGLSPSAHGQPLLFAGWVARARPDIWSDMLAIVRAGVGARLGRGGLAQIEEALHADD